MNKGDKTIAIFGIVIIIILAAIAVFLLFKGNNDSPIKVATEVELVELQDDVAETEVIIEDENKIMVYNGPVITNGNDNKSTDQETANTADTSNSNGKYQKKRLLAIKNKDAQMAEIFAYWNDGRMEAVYDLINLERVRNITKELAGTEGYYYYGDINESNIPNGKGLAIYENDTYYFGDWKSGLRDGNGILLKIFPNGAEKVGNYNSVTEHFYTGQWKADLPNGRGQENYSFALDDVNRDDYIVNAIGGFKNGYYNSDLIIYTVDKYGRRFEWRADANEGSFILREDKKISTTGKVPVWEKGDDNDHSNDENDNGYYWLKESDNSGWGVFGLMR